jgi:hypothetical protein
VKAIEQHARSRHQWRKTPEQPNFWSGVFAQTFFVSGGLRKYFIVHVTTDLPPAVTPTTGPSSVRSARESHRDYTGSRTQHITLTVDLSRNPGSQVIVQRIKEKRLALDTSHEAKMERLEGQILKQDRTG